MSRSRRVVAVRIGAPAWLHVPMHVGVLGPLQVMHDGQDVTPRGQRLRDVLVVLLQRRGRPVTAATLLEMVWGDRHGTAGISVVHTVIARLRRQLGSDAIIARESGYLVDRGTSTDEDAFSALLARARRHLDQGDRLAAGGDYRDALALWRGHHAFADTDPDLVEADRARLTELRAVAVEEWAAVLLDVGEPAGASEALRLTAELIAAQPLRERPYQLAMLAAYRCHRQADALTRYQDLRQRLRAELGIEPSPDITRLHTMILRQDPTLAGRATPVEPPVSPVTGGGPVPAPVSPLIGRQSELRRVLAAVTGRNRLITIIGPGGVGKSRLLVEVGVRLHPGKEVSYCDLSALAGAAPAGLAEAIAAARGVLDARLAPLDALLAAFGDGDWLLLIDEAESVVESLPAVLRTILDGCPGVQIVATSRVPLDVGGELLIGLEPLAYPEDGAAAELVRSFPAVQFLVGRLADRAFPVGDDVVTATTLASIARRVDGLPLALEIAVGLAVGRSLAEIDELMRSPLDVAAGYSSRSARHRSLRHTLTGSIDRLNPRQRSIFRRLGVFAGRFEMASAVAVAGRGDADAAAIIRTLARDGLIHLERTGPTRVSFRLLRVVRDLAGEGLAAADQAKTEALHRRWHAGKWRSLGDGLVPDVGEHLDDYVQALRSALDVGDAAVLTDVTIVLTTYWRRTGGQLVGLGWTGRVLDSGVLPTDDRARLLAHRAALALHHFPDIVLAAAEAAIPVLESSGQSSELILSYTVRAIELSARGRWSEALESIDRAVRLGRSGESSLLTATSVQAIARALVGNEDGADAAIDATFAQLDAETSTVAKVTACTNVGFAMLYLGRHRDALVLFDSIADDLDASAGRRHPDFTTLGAAWAAVGAGAPHTALSRLGSLLPSQVPGIADRQSAELYLGVGCVLADLDHPAAADVLRGANELCDRVLLAIPPAFRRLAHAAEEKAGSRPGPNPIRQPTTVLLAHLERTVNQALAGLT